MKVVKVVVGGVWWSVEFLYEPNVKLRKSKVAEACVPVLPLYVRVVCSVCELLGSVC